MKPFPPVGRRAQRAAGMCLLAVALLVFSSGCDGILRGDPGSARPDLVVESITHSLSAPSPGAPVTFTVTVRNQGGADAGLFNVGFWSDRAAEPGLGDRPDASCDVVGLATGDSAQVDLAVAAPAAGSYTAWAYVDRFGGASEVHESDEMNNVGPAGGYAWTVASSLVVNELDPASPDWCEIYNPFSISVDMTGWQVEFGLTASAYHFPAGFTLPPNGYVEIRENSGADTATVLYTGFNIGFGPSNGFVSLVDAGGIGVDFVRWGSSTDAPPAGTSWSGSITTGPVAGQTLGRDQFGTDTDDASDWENTCGASADSPTPGAANWLPPEIVVISPNGGETWCPGASETITWTSTSVPGNVDILYSTDGGSTWTPVDTDVANTGSYTWTVPVEDSPSCLVSVQETGGAGLSDTSDGVFTITVPPRASFPFVEDFETGSLASYWSVSSTATGQAVVATTNGPNGGAYHFLMDSSTSGTYALNELVLTIDLAGHSAVVLSFYCRDFGDEADAMPASFTGSSDSDGVAVSADGVTWYSALDLASAVSSTYQRFDVDLDTLCSASGISYNATFRIKFQQYDNFPIATDGFAFDDITLDPPPPPVILTHPSDATVAESETATFTVAVSGAVPPGYQWQKDGADIPGANASSYTTPATTLADDGAVFTCIVSNSGGSTTSNPATLTVIPPYITITAPNGGETWYCDGVDQDVTWTSGGLTGNVDIEYSTDGGSTWSLVATNVADTGSFTWSLPSEDSANCIVRMQETGAGGPSDLSDAPFTITPTTVTVIAPNGAESWDSWSSQTISWISGGLTDVMIELSRDGGATWETLAASVPAGGGSYPWPVTEPASANCIVRVSDAADSSPSDVSDGAFSIVLAVDHFDLSPIATPQEAGVPFAVTVTAKTSAGTTVTGFAGTVALGGEASGAGETVVGTGASSWSYPMHTYYEDARTQVIYLASEIGGPVTLDALALDVISLPGQTMNNWTIRMKHTSLSDYSGAAQWESSGWTTVYQASETVSSTGWVTFSFAAPFAYNGVDNLMVDFSFNNTHWTSSGSSRSTAAAQPRTLYYRTDSGWGDPLGWSATTPTPSTSTYVPNVKLIGLAPVGAAVQPATSGAFAAGEWTGNVTVPGAVAGIILTADDGSGHTGQSNVFDVNGIGVTLPNGGETWLQGEGRTITWTSLGVAGNVDILYSTDDGSTWTPVDTDVANTGSYAWTVPVEDSPSCLVRVEETGGAGLSDTSDGVFTIAVPPRASFPFVEDFETGTLADYWSVSSTATGRAIVATTNGPNGGTYHFLMDSSASGTYALNELVLTIDLTGQSAVVLSFYCKDFGDEPETMPASFTGSSDSDGVAVSADGVTWYSALDLASAVSSTYQRFDVDLDTLCSVNGISYNSTFKIKFQQYDDNPITTDGFAFDDITVEVAQPPVIATHPSDAIVTEPDAATFSVVATGVMPLSYQWRMDGVDIPGADASTYTTPPTTLADEGSVFTCVVTNLGGSITSNGGMLWVNMAPPSITTQPADQTTYENETATFTLVATGSGLLTYQWRRDGVDIPGATASIYTTPVTALGDDGAVFTCAVTNARGSVTSAPAVLTVLPASISVTAPNGGETWFYEGPDQDITWTSGGVTGNVRIRYSTNGGTSWKQVVANAPNTGSYVWTIPNEPSATCLVRVQEAGGGVVSDDSDAPFAIAQASVTVSAPNGAEDWDAATTQTVSWTSVGFSDVEIDISRDGGGSWEVVVGSTPAAAGSYSWTVTGPGSTNCLMRVSDAADGAPADESDAPFTVSVKPELVIESITHTPTTPDPGVSVTFTVMVRNLGVADAGLFEVGFWSDRASEPTITDAPEQVQDITSLAAGAATTLDFVVTAPSSGSYTAWAYADRRSGTSEVDESIETNNGGPPGGHAWDCGIVSILTFTLYADTGATGEYQKTLTAISTYFPSYVETPTTTTDPATLAAELAGVKVFLIPEQESAAGGVLGALGTSWAAVLTNFVNAGGTVIACSWVNEEHLVLNDSGLMSIARTGTADSVQLVQSAPHVVTAGVTFPFSNPYVAKYSTTDGTHLVETQSGAEPVVIVRDVGTGHVAMIGTDFFTLGTDFDRIIANVVQW